MTNQLPAQRIHGGDRYTTDSARIAEEQVRCFQLKLAGMSIRQIAAETGLSRTTVWDRIQSEIRLRVNPLADQLREIEIERLDMLTMKACEVLAADHPLVSNGRLIRGQDGQPMQDAGPKLAAIDRLLKIMERRAKLLGLDAPEKVDHTVTETTQEDLALRDMIAEAKTKMAAEEARIRGEATGETA